MGIESGPSFNGFGFESEPAVSEIARAEMMIDIFSIIETSANRFAMERISADPILHELLTKVIESGPEMDPSLVAHMRRMIAFRLRGATDVAVQATEDKEFYQHVAWEIREELLGLEDFEKGLSDVPDLWDIAYEDLCRLEDGK